MNQSAILHIPMSNYAHGINETRIVFRLRAAKGDLTSCNLFYGDTACRQTPILFTKVRMELVASDQCFDYYEADFDSKYHRIYYYFEVSDGIETLYYYSDFFHKELVTERSEYYKLPFNRPEDIATLPDWVTDAIVYNIFPDSFADGYRHITGKPNVCNFGAYQCHTRLGGTIAGIKANISYFKKLGVNCIYINPIFAAGEYHKYDTIDYFHIDPCFGSNQDMKDMVAAMHKEGIRVMIDGVFNHCGCHFFAFEDVLKNQEQSAYKDWFYRLHFPVSIPKSPEEIPDYECYAYERLMPKLNTKNEEVKQYLLQVGEYWIKEFDIDGWRLDVASEVDDEFWREFRKVTKKVKEDCFLIGEVWESAGHWLDGTEFDSTMNYDLRKHCTYFFALEDIDASEFDARVTNMRIRYRKNLMLGQLNLLDSHDVSRFYSVCDQDMRKWKLAILFQMFFVGIPSIFYGDEQMILGTSEAEFRGPMRFDEDNEIYQFYQNMIAIRKKYACIKIGEYRTIYAKEGQRLYVFERFLSDKNVDLAASDEQKSEKQTLNSPVLVCLNAGKESISLNNELNGIIQLGNAAILYSHGVEIQSMDHQTQSHDHSMSYLLKGYGALILQLQ